MKNSETLKLFADPVFKYKFDDFEELNRMSLQIIFMNFKKMTKRV